jgi:lipopolysaccharide biosynthesis glycosyltransferase
LSKRALNQADVEVEVKKIAVGIDDGFVLPLLTLAFSSLPEGARREWHLFFFERKLSVNSRELLAKCFRHFGISLHLHEEEEEAIFDSRRHLSSATFLKFRAFEFLGPGSVWLDSDLLLLTSWSEYEKWIDADQPLQAISDDKVNRKQFNAGFMLLNKELPASWMDLIANAPKDRTSSDQVIFNAIYKDGYGKLPKRFNFLWGKLLTDSSKIRPSVIHYGGANKPWHLPPRLSKFCIQDDCVWKPYLMIQAGMIGGLPESIQDLVKEFAKRTRRTKMSYYKKEALGRHFSYFLEKLGPFSDLATLILRTLSLRFPEQALHPVHAKKNAWSWYRRLESNEVV